MEASDMLDVVHFYFEQDHRYSTFEEASFKDQFRSSIFKNLYNSRYEFGVSDDESVADYRGDRIDSELSAEEKPEAIEPFNPRAKSVKGYVPPTDFNENSSKPFGSVLDEPLG
jgi:hypothetical protein